MKRINFVFCDLTESSRGVRDYLCSSFLRDFKQEFPHVDLKYYLKRSRPPYMTCLYVNGYLKDLPLANKRVENVHQLLFNAINQFGKQATPFEGRKVYTTKESIQGKWRDNMWGDHTLHELERKRPKPLFLFDAEAFTKDKRNRVTKRNDEMKFVLSSEERETEGLDKI